MNQDREFEGFFKENQNTVFRVVFGYVWQREIAEDITVDAFVNIFKRWQKVKKMKNPAGYVVRTGINLAKTHLKKDGQMKTVEVNNILTANAADCPEKKLFLKSDNAALEQELLKLKEKERNVILLKDLARHKFSEIAQMMDMKLPTVKSIYRRAKMTLVKNWEARDES